MTDLPVALAEFMEIPKCGGELSVYEGLLSLSCDRGRVEASGRVYYSFAEKVELLFEGEGEDALFDWVGEKVRLEAGDAFLGNALVLGIRGKQVNGTVFSFETKTPAPCERWRWCYLNAARSHGDPVLRGRSLSMDRLVFQDGGYEIILENKASYQQQKQHREISHYCELRHQDGSPVPWREALEEISLFSRFVSFFDGCQHAPFFIEGLVDDKIQAVYNSVGDDNSLTGVSSWKPDFKDKDLVPLWHLFRTKYRDSSDQADVLNTVVHWYLQANMNKGLLEGAFILGFTGLELLSNEIVGKELGNEDLIEDLVSRLQLKLDLEAREIARMRNYLVHYKNEQRRRTYNSLTEEEKVNRLEHVLLILELSILYWLGYEGHYANRLHPGWRGENVARVPWI